MALVHLLYQHILQMRYQEHFLPPLGQTVLPPSRVFPTPGQTNKTNNFSRFSKCFADTVYSGLLQKAPPHYTHLHHTIDFFHHIDIPYLPEQDARTSDHTPAIQTSVVPIVHVPKRLFQDTPLPNSTNALYRKSLNRSQEGLEQFLPPPAWRRCVFSMHCLLSIH